ncbi:hypothetical protein [Mycobacterium sp. 852002-10029_SCH5224772]|jgi:hypothetical protein|uniref:hypothetical protein n=1 Tax=Mycobacterium sp. 852002-10029_SCH5224772 TaxID=1834083 RepID=UPI0007FEF4EF|nr:hypothetical protein [Mycobacterium sp. 852002-10029_SCH5224772]OBE96278.1 hypothetical protein A5775_10580 [Mycobacterium sp. 852002-10029_SCH5224772]
MVNRGPLVVFAAVVFLAGGLLALRFPVFIEAYDQFGWQVKCGSGFTTDLTQASDAEKKPSHRANPGASHPAGGNYVGQCNSALMARRVWAIPAAALGGLTLTWAAAAALAHDRRARTEHNDG